MVKVYSHGDVNLIQGRLPKGAKLIEKVTRKVLAEGETTGHKHVITTEVPDTTFSIYEANGVRCLVLGEAAVIIHEEHTALTIAPGTYKQVQEREYDWFSLATRTVID